MLGDKSVQRTLLLGRIGPPVVKDGKGRVKRYDNPKEQVVVDKQYACL